MVFSHGYRTRVYNSNNGAFWGRLVFDVPRICFVFAQGCRKASLITKWFGSKFGKEIKFPNLN